MDEKVAQEYRKCWEKDDLYDIKPIMKITKLAIDKKIFKQYVFLSGTEADNQYFLVRFPPADTLNIVSILTPSERKTNNGTIRLELISTHYQVKAVPFADGLEKVYLRFANFI